MKKSFLTQEQVLTLDAQYAEVMKLIAPQIEMARLLKLGRQHQIIKQEAEALKSVFKAKSVRITELLGLREEFERKITEELKKEGKKNAEIDPAQIQFLVSATWEHASELNRLWNDDEELKKKELKQDSIISLTEFIEEKDLPTDKQEKTAEVMESILLLLK